MVTMNAAFRKILCALISPFHFSFSISTFAGTSFLLFTFYFPSLLAQPANSDILQVKFYYDSFEFDKAISAGNNILQSQRRLAPEELAFLHQYLALSFYNTGQPDSARVHFLNLLSVNPGLELDPVTISPKIIEFFNEIKKDYQALSGSSPSLAHTKYVFVEDLRPAAAWRSALLPGWGQFYKGQKAKGYVLGGAFWGSLLATGVAWVNEDRAHQDYLDSQTPADIENNYADYNKWYKTRRSLALASAVLWAVALGDAIWSSYPQPGIVFNNEGEMLFSINLRF